MNSIVTDYTENCFFCGKDTKEKHHLVFGRGKRELADRDGLVVPCCSNCHTQNGVSQRLHGNPMAEKLSKMLGQAVYEAKIGNRESFRQRYGVSYL